MRFSSLIYFTNADGKKCLFGLCSVFFKTPFLMLLKKKKKKAVAFGGNVCLSSDLILRMIIMVLNVFQLVGYIAKKMVQGDLRIRGSSYCCQI